MTDISVATTAYGVEQRSWYLGTAEQPGFTLSVTLDISEFTEGTHYPDGFIPSGTVLGRASDDDPWGPYSDDGEAALLFSSVKVPSDGHDVGAAGLVAFAPVDASKLPFQDGDGSLGDLGVDALPQIYFLNPPTGS